MNVLLNGVAYPDFVEVTMRRRIHPDRGQFGDGLTASAPASGSTMGAAGRRAHPLPHLHARFKIFLPASPLWWSSLTHFCSATWRAAIANCLADASPRWNAQLHGLSQWRPTTWEEHFTRIDAVVRSLEDENRT